MIKNKKAWLRIVEAVIAILIISGTILVLLSRQNIKPDLTDKIHQTQTEILDIISKNDSLREMVIQENKGGLTSSVSKIIPANWNFEFKICNITEICTADTPHDKDVYVREALISSTINQYQPRKLKFFVWMK